MTHSTGKRLMTATNCTDYEHVILVDLQDLPLGTAEKLTAHQQNLLHRAFSIFVYRYSSTGEIELLLQQRAFEKYHSAGLWTNTCCSHPRPGESILAAAKRRLQEEFGFTISLKQVGSFHYNAHFENGLSENEIDHVLIGELESSEQLSPNLQEIRAFNWVTISKLDKEMLANPQNFTSWLSQALNIVKTNLAS